MLPASTHTIYSRIGVNSCARSAIAALHNSRLCAASGTDRCPNTDLTKAQFGVLGEGWFDEVPMLPASLLAQSNRKIKFPIKLVLGDCPDDAEDTLPAQSIPKQRMLLHLGDDVLKNIHLQKRKGNAGTRKELIAGG